MFHFAYEVPLVAIREASVREPAKDHQSGNSQGLLAITISQETICQEAPVRGKGDMSVDVSRVLPDKTKPKQHMLYDS